MKSPPNRINIDLDLEKLLGLTSQLPELRQRAQTLGVTLPPALEKAIPAISFLGGLAGQMISSVPQSGLEVEGPHDPGPLGEGQRALLRGWASFTDAELLDSFEQVMETKAPAVPHIWRSYCALVEAASRQPDVNKAPDTDRRAAVHMLLSGNLLEERTAQRLGDMMYYGISLLRRRPRLREGAQNGG